MECASHASGRWASDARLRWKRAGAWLPHSTPGTGPGAGTEEDGPAAQAVEAGDTHRRRALRGTVRGARGRLLLPGKGDDHRVDGEDAVFVAVQVEIMALDPLGRLLERDHRPEGRHLAECVGALVEAVCGPAPKSSRNGNRLHSQKVQAVGNFLERVYHESRNLGVTAQERAINYAATNALNIERVYESAMKEDMDLEGIEVERSPVCRPDSDCWDVKLMFFFPQRQVQTVRKAYRFTVDVSDVVPIIVGKMRSWFVR